MGKVQDPFPVPPGLLGVGLTMMCKIRITKGLEGVFTKYQPIVGKIYDADYSPKESKSKPEMAVIMINGKKIIVRRNEFELVEGDNGKT